MYFYDANAIFMELFYNLTDAEIIIAFKKQYEYLRKQSSIQNQISWSMWYCMQLRNSIKKKG